jgi:pteridine reductase
MTRSLAVDFAARNPRVRINCVLADSLGNREGVPEHVAHAVLFFLENDLVTGVCLPMEGGGTIA